MRRALTAALALLMIAGVGSRTARAASLFDPLYKFRRLPTEHFLIYFHQGEDRMAGRLAIIAEEAWRKLERPLGTKPPPLTHVVLVDQTELSNGYTYVLPRDTVVIDAVWPSGSEFIGSLDDWLTLVFTHEFTHVVHLDRSEGWARVVRNVFGRVAYAFPNLYLPGWQIEGLATYEETAITGDGRLHAPVAAGAAGAAVARGVERDRAQRAEAACRQQPPRRTKCFRVFPVVDRVQHHPALAHSGPHGAVFVQRRRDGFFTQYVYTGPRRSDDRRRVQRGRGGDVDEIQPLTAQQLVVIRVRPDAGDGLLRQRAPARVRVGYGDNAKVGALAPDR